MKKIAIVISVLCIPVLVFLMSNVRMAAYYNDGNDQFQKTEYEKAIEDYQDALRWFPLRNQECDIRINLAKAIAASADLENLETKEDVEEAIRILEEAREVLLENGFASDEEGGGSSKKAQQLKEEIDQKIEELKNASDENQSGGEDTEDTGSDETGETEEIGGMSQEDIENIEQALEEIEEQSAEERYEELLEYQEFDSGYYWTGYGGMTW